MVLQVARDHGNEVMCTCDSKIYLFNLGCQGQEVMSKMYEMLPFGSDSNQIQDPIGLASVLTTGPP